MTAADVPVRRPYVQDTLAQGIVNGHLVQLYVTTMYVGTQDLWQARIVKQKSRSRRRHKCSPCG